MRGLKFSLLFLFLSLLFAIPNDAMAQISAIKNIFPKKVAAGNLDVRVRVVGKKNYKKTSVMLVNGTPVDTQIQNGTVVGNVSKELLSQPGSVSIAVRNGNETTAPETLSVVTASSTLTITAIRPRIVIAGDVSTEFGVEVQGENFKGPAIVRVGGFKTTTSVRRRGDLSFAVGTVDPLEVALVGTLPIQIENGDGTLSNTVNVIVTPPGPNLSELEPNSLDVGAKTTVVKIKGGNFTEDSKVFINDIQVPAVQKKGKKSVELDATVDASFFTKVGQLQVKVVTPNVGDSEVLLFDVTPPGKAPLIFSIDPSNIVAGNKDVEMIVLGANLDNVKNVTFNGTKVKSSQIVEISKRALKVVVDSKLLTSPTTLNLVVTTKDGATTPIPLVVEPSASVSTLLGSIPGFTDGSGKDAKLANPSQLAIAPDGMIYIADQANNAIRKFNPLTNELSTVAGDPNGAPGYVDTSEINDKNPTVRFSNPIGIVIDTDGTMYVTDFGNECIRRMRPNSQGTFTVDTLAGKSRMATNEDGKKERVGEMGFLDDEPRRAVFSGPYGIVMDPDRNILVTDAFNNVIRRIVMVNGEAQNVVTILGNGFPGLSDGTGSSVQFNRPLGLVMRNNKLIVSDFANNSIRQVDMDSQSVQVFVGLRRRIQSSALGQTDANNPTFGDGNKFFAVLSGPISSTFDSMGNLYVLDFNGNRVRRVTPDGIVTTIVGGTRGFVDGTAAKVAFRDPRFMLMVDDKTIIIVDSGNNRIRRVGLP
jgi:sugar lactone lactonase YvrE